MPGHPTTRQRRSSITWHFLLLLLLAALGSTTWHLASDRLPTLEETLLLQENSPPIPEAARLLFQGARKATRSPWPMAILLGLVGLLEWITFWKRSWESTNLLLFVLCLGQALLLLSGFLILVPIFFKA